MKIGVIITTFNRPQYLKRCLESIRNADLSLVDTILISDDHSDDPETKRLINEFEVDGPTIIRSFSPRNMSIKGSLLFGCDILFTRCNIVTNLDADAIVTKDAFNKLFDYKKRFPGHIVTGFNCTTKNRDGSIRHKILSEAEGYNMKASVGGINMIFDSSIYSQIIRPALQKCLAKGGNWDHQSCITSMTGYGKEIVCMVPSCVQHIGIEQSAMNHMAGGEPPDVADDFPKDIQKFYEAMVWTPKGEHIPLSSLGSLDEVKQKYFTPANQPELTIYGAPKIQLKDVTLIGVDDNIDGLINAANISCLGINFKSVKLLSSQDSADSRAIKIRHLGSKKEYSQFLLKEIVDYIDTPYFIVIQADGFILDFTKWRSEFLKWDWIGAVWNFRDHKKVGNGGFSLRSKRLHSILKDDKRIVLRNDDIISNFAEDHVICYIYRDYLEAKYGIKFAPEEIGNKFSIEAFGVTAPANNYSGSFGFHGFSINFNEASLSYIPYNFPNKTKTINPWQSK